MTFFSEQGLTETQVLQRVCDLLKERDPTFLISRPFAIPGTDYGLFGKSLEAFFKLSSGSIANMVIFLEAVHRGKLAKEALIELIENQLALPDKLNHRSTAKTAVNISSKLIGFCQHSNPSRANQSSGGFLFYTYYFSKAYYKGDLSVIRNILELSYLILTKLLKYYILAELSFFF
jgi:hypothetical protein